MRCSPCAEFSPFLRFPVRAILVPRVLSGFVEHDWGVLLKEEVNPPRDEIRLRTAKLKAGQEEKLRIIHVA